MRFGAVPVHDAVGAVLAHTLRAGDRVLKKGRLLSAAGRRGCWRRPVTARSCARQLDPGELAEDAAAGRIAAALAGPARGSSAPIPGGPTCTPSSTA